MDRQLSCNPHSAPQLRLFVTGVPRHAKIENVRQYFLAFGDVHLQKYESYFKSIEKSTKDRVYRGPGGAGYFILLTHSSDVYHAILNHKPHTFQGRSLGISKLRTGLDLILYNSQLNNRKVILKKVPAYIGAEGLKSILLDTIGPVEKIFEFRSENASVREHGPSTGSRNFKSFTVIFENKSDAKYISKVGLLQLAEGTVVKVEKFKRSKAESKTPINILSRPPDSRGDVEYEKVDVWRDFTKTTITVDHLERLHEDEGPEKYKSKELTHHTKPTSPLYFKERLLVLGDSWRSHDFEMLRLNLCYSNQPNSLSFK